MPYVELIEHMLWCLFKSKKEIIKETLKKVKKPLSVREIAELTGINIDTVRGKLFHLHREGKVKRAQKGLYEHA